MPTPAAVPVRTVEIDDPDPSRRWRPRGEALTGTILDAVERYPQRFATIGVQSEQVRAAGDAPAPFGGRWATLATIAIESDECRLSVSTGSSLDMPHPAAVSSWPEVPLDGR